MRAWKKPETEDERFARCLGHYAAAVAEALIADGLSVSLDAIFGPRMAWDEAKEKGGPDVEVFEDAAAYLAFGHGFRRRVAGGKGCELRWEADSGWYFFVDDINVKYEESMAAARWLGAGLVPEPARVVQFVSALLLDPGSAGSSERPYYRTAGKDPQAVVSRLEAHVPKRFHGTTVVGNLPWKYRHDWNRSNLVSRQVVSTMTSTPGEPWTSVPIRASEAEALSRLLELLEMSGPPSALTTLGHNLGEDLRSRLAGRGEAEQQQRGMLEAVRLKEHFEKYPRPE